MRERQPYKETKPVNQDVTLVMIGYCFHCKKLTRTAEVLDDDKAHHCTTCGDIHMYITTWVPIEYFNESLK